MVLGIKMYCSREKELKRNKRLAIIRSAESENVSIPANSTVTLRCITSKELDYHPTCAMLVPTEKFVLTDDCDITPAVVHYTFGKMVSLTYRLATLQRQLLMYPLGQLFVNYNQ